MSIFFLLCSVWIFLLKVIKIVLQRIWNFLSNLRPLFSYCTTAGLKTFILCPLSFRSKFFNRDELNFIGFTRIFMFDTTRL